MKTSEILEREHGWIERMASCLEKLVADARMHEKLAETAAELLFLYESFADGRHQEKEELVLFPELLSGADEEARAILERHLDDHVAERRLMASMRSNLVAAVHGEPLPVREFARAAGEYLDLHRAHMQRENETLFPMTGQLLTPETDARVVAGFETIEGGPGDPHALEEQIGAICRRVGLPSPDGGTEPGSFPPSPPNGPGRL